MKELTINVEDMSEEYGSETWNVNAYDQDGDTEFTEDFDNKCEALEFGRYMYRAATILQESLQGKANTLLIIEGNCHTLKMGNK